MIGIVVVSHSPRLAQAAVDLALEMVGTERPAIAIAAGAGEGLTGTDAVRVAAAIDTVASPEGVLVMMDLGSAVLSAELALEFVTHTDLVVRLTSAPFVEGLLAGIVSAAGGATLDAVEREALGALGAKQAQLGHEGPAPTATVAKAGEVVEEVTLINPAGLHARPAALLVALAANAGAEVTVTNLRTNSAPVLANSLTGLLSIGARQGDVLRLAAAGAGAQSALDSVRALVATGFGELEDAAGVESPVSAHGCPPNLETGESTRAAPQGGPNPETGDSSPKPSPRGGALGVSPGSAVGPVVRMPEPHEEPAAAPPLPESDRAAAAARVGAAAASVESTLRGRAGRVVGEAREILEATAMMAADPMLLAAAGSRVVTAGEAPERAVWLAAAEIADQFSAQGALMAERVTDLLDVRDRIVAELAGAQPPGVPERDEPFVLVARDLAPADTALLDPALCVALVTVEGGPTSHTAILARALGIPAIVGVADALQLAEGAVVIVDGTTGTIVVDPTAEQVAAVVALPRELTVFSGEGGTSDGHRVELLANVASPASVTEAVSANAEGVGLFRTEFCFLDRSDPPGIEEQVAAYRSVFAAFGGRKVIIRTLDAGADKPLPFVTEAGEPNPALGIRGYRTSWRKPGILDDQLRAIALAAAAESAAVGVMAPMIDTPDDAAEFARLCGLHGLSSVGVMIETPAAAVTAQEIIERVDFVSIGTNDLAQYTMAADRQLGQLAPLNDPWQPAVLRMIQSTCTAGVRTGKSVGVCGEAAADPLLAAVLVGLGATSLSMSPRALGAVARLLGSVTLTQCQAAASASVAARSAADARGAAGAALHPTV